MDAPQGVDVNELKIRPISHLLEEDFLRLVTGYTSLTRYAVQKTESHERTSFSLELVKLDCPYQKQWEYIPQELVRYNDYLKEGYSFYTNHDAVDGEVAVFMKRKL